MSNPRVRKIADRVKVLVAELLERRVKDPRLGFVTITDVRVTGDTQHATIYYTVLGAPGGEADLEGTAAALASARGMLRSEVGKQLSMRQVPTLEFVYDGLPESARQIEDLLERVRQSDEQTAQAHAGAAYAGEPDPYRKPREDDDLDDLEDAPVEAAAVEDRAERE